MRDISWILGEPVYAEVDGVVYYLGDVRRISSYRRAGEAVRRYLWLKDECSVIMESVALNTEEATARANELRTRIVKPYES